MKTERYSCRPDRSSEGAVTHLDGPMLVVAGPGSGKTRVITRRVAWLASQGVLPRNILGLTFTNKAAEEMRSRLDGMGIAAGATLSTFHSLCARLLREFAGQAGLKASFTIYDESDRKAALREACRESGLDFQLFPPARLLRRISRFKNQLQTPDDISDQGYDHLSKVIKDYYQAYQDQLDRNAALDFDDLLMRMACCLKIIPNWPTNWVAAIAISLWMSTRTPMPASIESPINWPKNTAIFLLLEIPTSPSMAGEGRISPISLPLRRIGRRPRWSGWRSIFGPRLRSLIWPMD